MTARQIWAQVADIAACAAYPVAILLVAIALSLEVDAWLALPVVLGGLAVATVAGVARALWYRRGGAR